MNKTFQMKFKLLTNCYLISLLLLQGCSTIPTQLFTPANLEDNGKWVAGVYFQTAATDELIVNGGMVEFDYDAITFDLNISNLSPTMFEWNPIELRCVWKNKGHIILDVPIIDPETILKEIKKEKEDLENDPFMLSFLDYALNLASIGEPDTPEKKEQEREKELEKLETEQKIRQLKFKYLTMSNTLLRRHSLAQGESIKGIIKCENQRSFDSDELVLFFEKGLKSYQLSWNVGLEK